LGFFFHWVLIVVLCLRWFLPVPDVSLGPVLGANLLPKGPCI